MKKIFLPIVVSLLLAGCDDDMVRSKADLTLLVSFVPYYEDNEPFNITPSGLGLLQGWFGLSIVFTRLRKSGAEGRRRNGFWRLPKETETGVTIDTKIGSNTADAPVVPTIIKRCMQDV